MDDMDLYGGMRQVDFFALPDAELRRRANKMMTDDEGIMAWGRDDYLNELSRRAADRQSRRLELLTWVIAILTVVIAVLTAALLWFELRH